MSFILINKPSGITSHDVVDRLRKITGEKKIGHAGTLDPNASGLLVLAIGRQSTKKLGNLLNSKQKEYLADIRLGQTRDTLDVEGKVTSENKDIIPKETELQSVLDKFKGTIMQTPPAHSALKIKGKKAYQLARQGKEVELAPREVDIKKIKLLRYQYPDVRIEVKVSAGTYIRSLARDIGEELGTGAYLAELVRTAVAQYRLENAVDLKELDSENYKNYLFEV